MQRKKNIGWIISLVLLTISTIVIYWQLYENATPEVDRNIFKVTNTPIIDHVILESNKSRVELKFDGSRWMVNDAYRADRNMIDVLFATLQQAEVKRPVAVKIQDSVSHELDAHGTHVILFEGAEIKNEFIAGGSPVRKQSFFKKIKEDVPYVMTIPGYSVYVSGIFQLDESGWRNKYAFGFNWQNFASLEVNFPENRKENFLVKMEERTPVIQGIAQTDTAKLNNFLQDVSLLQAEHFIKLNSDSLKGIQPIMEILIKDIGKKEYTLTLFPGGAGSESYPGLLQGKEVATFNRREIQSILRPKSYFPVKN